MKLICHVDCTLPPEEGKFFEIGETKVVTTEMGSYREATDNAQSRFGYRFILSDITKPHLMEIVYPDDKRRHMCINNGTSYDLSTGVVCGIKNCPSMKMHTIRNYFWARWADDCLVFSSWGNGESAAVSEFSIYELDEMPAVDIPNDSGLRDFGIQYEDPTNVGTTEGAADYDSWGTRVVQFMRFSGQNKLILPINWYHGPFVPVKCQPYGCVNSYCAPDRKIYNRASEHPGDWLDGLLTKFDKAGLSFTGSLTLLRLGNLMTAMNTDIDAIKAGKDTYNNILFNGKVQSSTNDWTKEYNAAYFAQIPDSVRKTGKKPSFLYNERDTSGISAPMFNPIHPTVRAQVKEYFRELASNYCSHPSFKGLAVNVWHSTLLWYSNLRVGYDDYSIGLFETATGIHTGVDAGDPERFEKRYDFIMNNALDKFVEWRCEKIHDFIIELRDAIRECRSDLTLTLTIWNETSAVRILGGIDANAQFGARKSNYELYRDGGIDLAMFADDDGIETAVEANHQRDCCGGADVPMEATHIFTDYTFLDSKTRDVMLNSNCPTSFIFNCWAEAWGNHTVGPCAPDDKNLKAIYELPDYKAETIILTNSEYNDDPPEHRKFFYDSQLRITSTFPTAPYFAEWIVNELAAQDSLSITAGGLYLDKSHVEMQREFSRKYRSLPRRRFNTAPGTGDPVTVRYLYDGNKTYIYAVNREPYEVSVTIKTNLNKSFSAKLSAFDLNVWIMPEKLDVTGYSVVIPEFESQRYAELCRTITQKVDAATKAGISVKGCVQLVGQMNDALKQQRYAFIRHALVSYPIEKTLFYLAEKEKIE